MTNPEHLTLSELRQTVSDLEYAFNQVQAKSGQSVSEASKIIYHQCCVYNALLKKVEFDEKATA